MDAAQKTELKDVEQKLSELRNRLDSLLQIVWGSQNVNSEEVLPAVNELLSLLEWAAQKPDDWPQGALLFMQLQGLQKIKQSLETTFNEADENSNEVAAAPAVGEQQGSDLTQEEARFCTELLLSNDLDVGSSATHIDEPCSAIFSQETSSEIPSDIGRVEDILPVSPDNNLLLYDDDNFSLPKTADVSQLYKSDPCSEPEKEEDILNLVSSGIGNLIKTNEEIKELLASNAVNFVTAVSSRSSGLKSSTSEVRDLLSSDIREEASNADILPKALNTLSNPVSEACDLLLDETGINVKKDTLPKSIQSDDFNLLTEPGVFAETTLKENPAENQNDTNLLKSDNRNEVITECLMQNSENVIKSETVSKEMFLNNLDILTQPDVEMQKSSGVKLKTNIEVEDILFNDPDVCQSKAEAKDLLLSVSPKTFPSNSEVSNLNFLEASISETREPVPMDNSGLIDLLTSSDDTPKTNLEDIQTCKPPNLLHSVKPMRNEIVVLETDVDDKTTELVPDPKITKDPLDICMFAIRNLYDNLRAKENELLKLSVIKNDQKHIEALQSVIVDFHKEITNLNSKMDNTNKENRALKEQVLELEEAENDARLKAQKLEQTVIFLQEKDLHAQGEISHLKKSLRNASEKALEKEKTEKELRSHVKYLETLVQKYEDQIKEMEAKESTNIPNHKKPETDPEIPASFEKGTQTYPYPKLKSDVLSPNGVSTNDSVLTDQINQEFQDTQTITNVDTSDVGKSVITCRETPQVEVFTMQDGLSLKDFNDRLCKLMHEDMGLQQEIHSVDQINLELWKKLQNLETNVGECKRKDVNDTELSYITKLADVIDPLTDVIDSTTDVIDAPSVEKEEKREKTNIPTNTSNQGNASNVKDGDLKTKDSCNEDDKAFKEWKETEKQLLADLKELVLKKDELVKKIEKLETEKGRLEQQVCRQQTQLNELKEKNQRELSKLKIEQESMCSHLQEKVNQLISEEKTLLKMIKNVKTERSNKYQAGNELEILKCNYIQLQIELSNSREEKRKLEESFKIQIDESLSKNKKEEARLMTELERLRYENMECDKTIKELQTKQQQLKRELDNKAQELKLAGESYQKSLEDTKKQQQSVERELKAELKKLEEGTVRATSALIEERLRVEEKLQENITNLRVKELSYLSRIEELEKSMIKLHEELHKVTEKSERNVVNSTIDDSVSYQKSEIPSGSSPETPKVDTSLDTYSDRLKIFEFDLKHTNSDSQNIVSSTYDIKQQPIAVEEPLKVQKPAAAQQPSTVQQPLTVKKPSTVQQPLTVKNLTKEEENVEDLRAQVRELQAQLEKISDEPETSSVTQGLAITAPCMGLQKEELDFAEEDECASEWRKSTLNSTPPKTPSISNQYRPVYENRYPSRYKYKSGKESQHAQRNSVEENVYDEILPRPTNLHVVQQVGPDALLVGWSYINVSYLEGFEIYLDNQLHERIYIPDRTKAILSGLNLRRSFTLSIRALSRYGQLSEPASLALSCEPQENSDAFEEEGDEYSDSESAYDKHRPYSMEW